MSGRSVPEAAAIVGVRPSTAKRHLADLRARSGLTTEQLIYRGRGEGWLVVASLESGWPDAMRLDSGGGPAQGLGCQPTPVPTGRGPIGCPAAAGW